MGGACCKEEPIDFSQEVELNHFNLLRVVGKGAFGKVRIVQHKQTKEIWALKYINKEQCIGMKAIDNIIQERKMLEEINHPFICNLRYAFQDDENLFMVIDLMLGGDMRFHLERAGHFSEEAVKLYMAECALALSYLHGEKKIVHRDLKPDNILLDAGGHAHLTDFNIAVKIRPERPLTAVAGSMAYMAPEIFVASQEREKERERERQKRKEKEREKEKKAEGEAGAGAAEKESAEDPATPASARAAGSGDKEGKTGTTGSSEALKTAGATAAGDKTKDGVATAATAATGKASDGGKEKRAGYNESVDWWSLGVVMYELLFEKRPFHGKTNELLQKSIMQDTLEIPPEASKFSPECIDCMKGFLTRDIMKRLGCKEAGGLDAIKRHPFFSSIDWDKVLKKEINPAFVPDPNACNFDASHELEELLLEDNPLRVKPRKHKPATLSPGTAAPGAAASAGGDGAPANPQLMARVHISTQASVAPGGAPTDGLSKEMMEMEMKFTVFDFKNAKPMQTTTAPVEIAAPHVPDGSMSSLNEFAAGATAAPPPATTVLADAGGKTPIATPSSVRNGNTDSGPQMGLNEGDGVELTQASRTNSSKTDPLPNSPNAASPVSPSSAASAPATSLSGSSSSRPNFFGSIRRRRSSKGSEKPAPLLKAPTVVVSSDSKGDLIVGVGETGGVPVIQGSAPEGVLGNDGGQSGNGRPHGATEAM